MAYETKKKLKSQKWIERSISHANSMIATKPIEEAPKSRLASKFQRPDKKKNAQKQSHPKHQSVAN